MKESTFELDGVVVDDLVERFGSPLFIVNGNQILQQADRLLESFPEPRFVLYYSLKANPSIAIMERLRSRGLGCDACGLGDLELASLAGWPGEAISLTGTGLSSAELSFAIERGVWINVDSLTELRRYCLLAPGGSVGLRVTPEVTAGFHPHCQAGSAGSKFGIALDEVEKALAIAGSHTVSVGTIHAHIGSGIFDVEPFLKTAQVLIGLARDIESVRIINLGGGLGGRYHYEDPNFPLQDLAEGLNRLIDDFESETGRSLTIALEPGEFLVGEAGYLVCTVRVVKHRGRGEGPRLAIVDASVNLLPASLIYGSHYPLYLLTHRGGDEQPWDICGRTNQAGDRLARGRMLPDLMEGDRLLFGSAGAYAACRASQFNEMPRPAEVLIEDGQAFLVRHSESTEDLAYLQTGFHDTLAGKSWAVGFVPQARTVRVDRPEPSVRPTIHYTVDGTPHRMSVDLRELNIQLTSEDREVLTAAWSVLLAQHVLAVEIDTPVPFHPATANCLQPILQMLYDVRFACDGRSPTPAPPLPRADSYPIRKTGSEPDANGTLLLFSGGVDSTVLLRLLADAGGRVEALHLRINNHVQLDEEVASCKIAESVGVPLHIVDFRLPGFDRLGRRYSRSFGIFPYYNSVPHGRDLVTVALGAIVARHRGLRRVALGYERDSYEKALNYRGRRILRHDVESEEGFEFLKTFVHQCISPNIDLIAPLAGVSLYRIRRIAMKQFPELFALTQSCFWGRRCESCLKCVATFVMQSQLRRQIQSFTRDLLDDIENEDLRTLVESATPARELGYGNLVRHTLARLLPMTPAGRRSYWLRRFAENQTRLHEDLQDAAKRCLEVHFERCPVDLRERLQRLIHDR